MQHVERCPEPGTLPVANSRDLVSDSNLLPLWPLNGSKSLWLLALIQSQAMDAVTRITLPPHLIEKIQLLLAEDIDLPKDLRAELSQAVKLRDDEASPILDSARDETASVPTIEEDLLLRASRWAQGAGAAALSRHNLCMSICIVPRGQAHCVQCQANIVMSASLPGHKCIFH